MENLVTAGRSKYEKKSLSDMVVLYIKNRILEGSLKSGDKLIEADISAALNTSRAPVREAMRILNEQGIVSFLPRKGNHVLEMTKEELSEVFEIRTNLEMRILQKLVMEQMLCPEDFRELDKMTQKMMDGERQCKSQEERIYMLNTMDIGFHRYLWNASRSSRRGQILDGLFYQLLIAMNQDTYSLGTFEEKAIEHMRIVEALKKADLPVVLNEFYEHLKVYMDASIGDKEQIKKAASAGMQTAANK